MATNKRYVLSVLDATDPNKKYYIASDCVEGDYLVSNILDAVVWNNDTKYNDNEHMWENPMWLDFGENESQVNVDKETWTWEEIVRKPKTK